MGYANYRWRCRYEKRIQDELNILKDIIIETVPVEQIILFVSYACGTQHADSDLDILVLMPEDADIREIDAMRLIHKAIRDKNNACGRIVSKKVSLITVNLLLLLSGK